MLYDLWSNQMDRLQKLADPKESYNEPNYKTICDKCGSSDLEGGYDVMLPLNREYNLDDFLDGSFSNYVYCNKCDDECMTTQEIKINETKQISQ